MEGTIGEIRLFAGNFAPRNWALCNGAECHITELSQLFSIIGTMYGGDGQFTFHLPDLRGRTAIGSGNGNGLSPRVLGEQIGTETVAVTLNSVPSHNHGAALAPPAFEAIVQLNAYNGKGTQVNDPTGAYMADSPVDTKIYSTEANTKMGVSNVVITENSPGGISVNQTGGSQPHNNLQPSIALNYIICTTGIFPSRN